MSKKLTILFDGPPSHESGRFIEVEDGEGHSFNAGDWVERPDGLWELQIDATKVSAALEAKPVYDDAAVERGARVLVEDGARGVPWEDATDCHRAETMGRVRAILEAALEG